MSSKLGVKLEKYPSQVCKPWGQDKLLILIPHGADYHWIVKQFPDLSALLTEDYISYLKIEADHGATELAHAIANHLNPKGVEVIIIKTLYNRGVLDGGRVKDYAVRNSLPRAIKEKLEKELLDLHEQSVNFIKEHCALIAADGGFVLDLHTMAPVCPVFKSEDEKHAHYESIGEYTKRFIYPGSFNNLRPVDILSEDENGKVITDEQLSSLVFDNLKQAGLEVEFNFPYKNHSMYMMNEYLSIANGIAIDFPKHLISVGSISDFKLDNFEIDSLKLSAIAEAISNAVVSRFQSN